MRGKISYWLEIKTGLATRVAEDDDDDITQQRFSLALLIQSVQLRKKSCCGESFDARPAGGVPIMIKTTRCENAKQE